MRIFSIAGRSGIAAAMLIRREAAGHERLLIAELRQPGGGRNTSAERTLGQMRSIFDAPSSADGHHPWPALIGQ